MSDVAPDAAAFGTAAGTAKPDATSVQGSKPLRSTALQLPSFTRYEYTEEYGEIAEPHPEFELILFRKLNASKIGKDIKALTDTEVDLEGPLQFKPFVTWEAAGFHPVVAENLYKCGYTNPLPIQAWTIPPILKGMDVIAMSATGSGKTAAFVAPILSLLAGKTRQLCAPRPPFGSDARTRAEPLVVILCPTRELANQIQEETSRLAYRIRLRVCALYGGASRRLQIDDIGQGCDILVSTPGRLHDFVMNEPQCLTLQRVMYTVMDEADEMLRTDWDDEIQSVILDGAAQADGFQRFLFFSATFPKALREVAKKYLAADYCRVRVGRIGAAVRTVYQVVAWSEEEGKPDAIVEILRTVSHLKTMIFCNTNRRVQELESHLFRNGFQVACLTRQLSQEMREMQLDAFRSEQVNTIVCTSVAARGLDIDGIAHVVNCDLPSTQFGGITEYTHRIGRTGRLGNPGQSTSLYNDKNEDIAPELVKSMMENGFEIPAFLEQFKPEDGQLNFEDDKSDDEGVTERYNEPGLPQPSEPAAAEPEAAMAW